MSRRSELQKQEAERLRMEQADPEKKLRDRIIELHGMDLYHYKGIAKLCNCSFRKVRETIRDLRNDQDNDSE